MWTAQGALGQALDEAEGLMPPIIPGLDQRIEAKIIMSVIVVALLLFTRRAVLAVVNRRVETPMVRYKWAKYSAYGAFTVGLLSIFQIWFVLQSLGTFLGLLSAGLAIALKDLVADLAGWLFILWRRPFDLGDRIQLGEHSGDVVDIRIFAFTLMEIGNWVSADQSTGRMIHMPNSKVFSEPLANYTSRFPFLWNELKVLVTFESDWKKAKEVLNTISLDETEGVSKEAERTLRQTTNQFPIHYRKLTPVVYTSVEDSGILLTIRYLCRPRQRRGTAEAIWERILDAFDAADDMDFAYPTQRLYLNPIEGKEGARATWAPLSDSANSP